MIASIFKLIRWKNLLFIALCIVLMRYALVYPLLQHSEFSPANALSLEPKLPLFAFLSLIAAILCIAAAGYIINDYFDRKTDLVNRPEEVTIATKISPRQAMIAHWILNIVGIGLGYVVAWQIDLLALGLIFALCALLLWYYSSSLTKTAFWGNIAISLLVGLVPLISLVSEIIPLAYYYRLSSPHFSQIVFWGLGYAYFAFWSNFVREIIKDMEDLEGDSAYGRNSIAIAWGMPYAKIVAASLIILIIGSLITGMLLFQLPVLLCTFLLFATATPYLLLIVMIAKANKRIHYTRASLISKIAMLGGLLSVLLLWNS
jgi:4-hydroxybenzoate polyprenyltransferase